MQGSGFRVQGTMPRVAGCVLSVQGGSRLKTEGLGSNAESQGAGGIEGLPGIAGSSAARATGF